MYGSADNTYVRCGASCWRLVDLFRDDIPHGMLTSWAAAAGLLTPPAITTRRAAAASLRLCATLNEGLEVAVFAMG